MITLDGNGIAAIIAGGTAGIVSLGTFAMSVINWRDSRRLKQLSMARDEQIKQVKDLVNGKSDQLTAFIAKEAFEAGRQHERNAPNEPSPPVAIVTPTAAALPPQCVPIIVKETT